MGGYYTPKMKEIKEVMVPPLVHLSQTAPYANLYKQIHCNTLSLLGFDKSGLTQIGVL